MSWICQELDAVQWRSQASGFIPGSEVNHSYEPYNLRLVLIPQKELPFSLLGGCTAWHVRLAGFLYDEMNPIKLKHLVTPMLNAQ